MNVMIVGLLCIAVYAVFVVLWLSHDKKNQDDYTTRKEDRS